MTHPIISIIVPIFNTAKLLDECLLSIRQQTLEEIEIICVDDCSPDNSYKIVEKHAQEDTRIRLIRHTKNKGQGGARNTGILAAKADYVAGVDSDDTIKPEMMEKLWKASKNGYFDIVCCAFDAVDIHGNIISQQKIDEREITIGEKAFDIFTVTNPAFWNKIWRRKLYVDNKIFFPENLYYEDMATTPRIVSVSKNMKMISFSGYNYFQRKNSITNTVSEKSTIDYFIAYGIVKNFLINKNLFNKYKYWLHGFVSGHLQYHNEIIEKSALSDHEKNIQLQNLIALKIDFFKGKGEKNDKEPENLYNSDDIHYLNEERNNKEILYRLNKKNYEQLSYYIKHAISRQDISLNIKLLRIKKTLRKIFK